MINRLLNRTKTQIKTFFKFGPSSIVDDLLNGWRAWSLKIEPDSATRLTGSISASNLGYVSIVKAATLDERTFLKFKSNREYREILEHVNRDLGARYLEVIKSRGAVPNKLLEFCKNDYCKPFRYTYKGIGRVSPSNLRYAKIALDLQTLFGSLSDLSISEIGVGYGGQLHAIYSVSDPAKYTLFDLPDVTKLASLYYSYCNLGDKKLVIGELECSQEVFDLVISNYAYSELDRNVQEKYFKNVISNSRRGYLIYNDLSYGKFDTMSVQEFASKIPGSEIIDEYPTTHSINKLVVWGHNNLTSLKQPQ